jgi:hypothetical protein
MTADDRVTVPEAHIDAVARVYHAEWCSPLCVAPVRHSLQFREPVSAVLTSTDPTVLDALAWAVTRTPEGRDKALAAILDVERATERWAKP